MEHDKLVRQENETRHKKNKPEITALNTELYNEFSIEELEQRLETKAWGCDCNGGYWECPYNSEPPPPSLQET